MLEIQQIPVLRDNYIYLIHLPDSGHTVAVDPAEAPPVMAALARSGWSLTHIFNTHHHADHVGGNLELKQSTGCEIVGADQDAPRIPGLDRRVNDGECFRLGNLEVRVMAVCGHTTGHVAYWLPEASTLFVGDTLFSLGCGRLFEGTADQMWASLERIRALPPDTRIYCAHEYTEANARFAITVEPDNRDLQQRLEEIRSLRQRGLPTVPSLLSGERACNPFLRPESPAIRAVLGLMQADNVTVFSTLRRMKDVF